jgi:hypothetical protein
MGRLFASVLLAALLGGCVERTLTVQSDPPGALVFMNDQEVGRTPLTRRFIWYGYYDVQVRKEGYQTLNTTTSIIAPWWQWVPFDFVAELLPLRLEDSHLVSYTLKRLSNVQIDPESIVDRGQVLGERLESGHPTTRTAKPTTRPATRSK